MSERKKYDLSDKIEEYPGVFRWNVSWYILVKDGEHYPIAKKKMDTMYLQCRGKVEEIVKHYKPRQRRAKDPNAVVKKSKAQIYMEAQKALQESEVKYEHVPTMYINPDYIDPSQRRQFDSRGFKIITN